MPSGNFLIGKQGLSLKGFNEHFRPELEEKGFKIEDIIRLGDPNGILISLVGKQKLEQAVEECVRNTYKKIDELYAEIKKGNMSAYNFQVDFFETLGLYEDDKTASGNFPLFAQRYLCDATRKQLDMVAGKIKGLANKKISDF